MANVDPRAIVSPEAELADDVVVGPYSIIGAGVRIGAGTWIGPHAVINGPTTIGRDNRIWQFASIGDAPQDKKYAGEPTRLEIGDRNVFRECCTINRGTVTGRGVTTIGSDGLFMAYSHVAHDCIVRDRVIMSNCTALAGHVEIDDWVILSGYAAVHQFCKIGAHVFLANNAAVTRDVPPYLMVAGSPAEPVTINAEGLKRRGFSAEQIANVKHGFKVLYKSGLKLAEATAELEKLGREQPEVQAYVDFFPRVTRSLIR
ncbi:MAG: acyl-ACP--UDP-N-acetylglucosamine O-acyltransferase [Steroidobacteraceae bacterium]|jgi:UDP-N-acetylglucosamine acyltransferase|nr:acyl-ACP--UDP-N-acetylglucosamine O-acyltransferase [Steroidobacteraceae bacterium]